MIVGCGVGYRGYIGINMNNGRSVPQHIQQLIIRDYCEKNDLKFLLSATEYHSGIMMLYSLLESDLDGIVFYSIGLMPKSQEARQRLYKSGKDIRFAAENLRINIPLIETTIKVGEWHGTSQFCDTVTRCKQA